MTISVLITNNDMETTRAIDVVRKNITGSNPQEEVLKRLGPKESQEFHVWKEVELVIREVFPCLLMILAPLLFAGCEYASAAQEPPKAPLLWSESDAQEALTILRSVRQNEKTLQAINSGVNGVQTSVDSLTEAVGQTLTTVEGIEQRLDNPLPPAVSQAASTGNAECVTIDGVDTDLDRYLAENYSGPWSDGQGHTASELRKHLADLGVTETENVALAKLEKLHAARHEQKDPGGVSALSVGALAVGDEIQLFGDTMPPPPPAPDKVTPNPPAPEPQQYECINGQCRLRTKTVSVSGPAGTRSSVSTVQASPGNVVRATNYSYSLPVGHTTAQHRRQARLARRGR